MTFSKAVGTAPSVSHCDAGLDAGNGAGLDRVTEVSLFGTTSGSAVSHHLPLILFSAQRLEQLLATICLLSYSLHSVWISC